MPGTITLIGSTWENRRPVGIDYRPVSEQDAEGLARLYFAAYDDGSVTSQAAALEIVQQLFSGEFGRLLPEASPVVVDDSGRIVAAVLVLESRKGDDLPQSPYIFELFTAASRRRQGLAEQMLRVSIDTLHRNGYHDVALRISETNYAALALYLTLDFNRWTPEDEEY